MECDAAPGEALLIVHRRVVVDVGVMIGVFLEDGEDACGCLVAGLAGRDSGDGDADSVAIDGGKLAGEIDVDEDGTLGRDLGCPYPFAGLEVVGETGEFDGRGDLRSLRERQRDGE